MRHRTPSRGIAALLSLALVLGLGAVATVASGVVTAAPAQAATGTLSLGHGATPASVLAGEDATIALRAEHTGAAADIAYNLTFVATLPPGATYVAGSATPASGPGAPGEPTAQQVVPNPADPSSSYWVLVWSNVTDLPAGGVASLGFDLDLDEARFPAGSTVVVPSRVLGSADERIVPKVTVATSGVTHVADASASDTAQTRVSPLEITKSEPSSESELLRGLEDQQTEYTLTVRVAPSGPVSDVVVRDVLPAALHFLGCESVSAPGGCATFTGQSVQSDASGAHTVVGWAFPSLAAGSTTTIRYRAAAGYTELNPGTSQFDGPSLRQQPTGTAATNTVDVTGTYQGAVASAGDRAASASAEHTVQVLDVALAKSADASSFTGGNSTRFTLDVRVGQYTDASTIVVTDTLPDGMCAYLPIGFSVPAGWPADCTALPRRAVVGATLTSAVMHADGTTTLTFQVPDVAANATAQVRYDAFMRSTHADGSPTATGETFTNSASLTATTTPVSGSPETGAEPVENGSSASVSSKGPTLVKQVWPNASRSAIAGAASCPAVTSPLWSTSAQPVVRLGDLVCFQITLEAATGVALRDVSLRDFVPVGTEFVDARVAATSSAFTITQTPGQPAWTIGDTIGSARYLPAAGSATFQVVARVTDTQPSGKDILGNLAKMRWRDADNRVAAQRTQVDFAVAPAAPLTLAKTVTAESGTSANQRTYEGEVVTYRLSVAHAGTAADASDHPVDSVELWDALPTGFTCADVVTAGVTCAAGATTSTTGRSVLRVTLSGTALGADSLLTAGETVTYDVQVRVPSPLSISSSHTNNASIVAYTVPTTDGRAGATSAVYQPSGSLADPTAPNAPAANASASVFLPGSVVGKTIDSTSVTEAGNNAATQATVGETVTYTYSATVPAKTTVFRGALTDTLPTGGRLTGLTVVSSSVPGATVSTYSSGSGGTCAPLAGVACLDTTTGALSLPPVYTNPSTTAWTVSVTVTARVANAAGNTHGSTLTNTAELRSRNTAAATTDVLRGTASAAATVVLPTVSVTKSPLNGSGAPVDPLPVGTGQTITYRLTAAQTATNRPPAHDTVVVDCLPVGMTPVTPLPAGLTSAAGTGSPCATNRTQITWAVGDVLSSGSTSIEYQAVIPIDAGGSASLVNTATVTASTLADGANDATAERVLSATDTGTVQLASPTGTKTSDVSWAVPGQDVTWTLVARLPANANYYDAAVIDVLPAGLTPDLASATITCTGGDTTWQTTCAGTPITGSSGSSTRLVWPLGDLAAIATERTITIELASTVDPAGALAAGSSAPNAFGVGWFQTDATRTVTSTTSFDRAPTLGTASVAIREPLVTVAKSVDDATVEPGQTFTYTVTASGSTATSRAVTAHAVTVVDTVPQGVVPLTASNVPAVDGDTVGGGTWDASARTVTWTAPTLASGASVTYTFPARLAPADSLTGAALTNSARATSWSSLATDGRTYGPTVAATAGVTPQFPRVNATKSQTTANPVVVDQEVSYAVTLTNAGTAPAESVEVTDTLPTGWQYVADSATIQVGAGTAVDLDDPTGTSTLVWSNVLPTGTRLAASGTATLRYRATPTSAAASSSGSAVAHTNTVAVTHVTDAVGGDSYDDGDGTYLGTGGSATARLHAADLSVTKTASTWVAGTSTNTWTVTVRNNGPDPAVGVVVHDAMGPLPTGVTFVSIAGTGATCVAAPGSTATSPAQDCTLSAPLASGASVTLTVTTSVTSGVASGTTASNTATVTAATYDPDPSNDSATSTATVTTVADLELVKTGPSSVDAGALATWVVTVTNRGPSVSRASLATPIVVSDALPAGVSVTSVVPSGASCTAPSGGTLTCTRTSDLASGASFSVEVTGRVSASLVAADGPLVNQAEVTPVTGQGADTYDDEDSTSTAITHAESLTITKTIVGDLVAGSTGTYAITVSNAGPSVARGVVVTDDLPTGLTYAGGVDSDDDWTCTGTTSVTCELGDVLGVGAAAASTFTFDVSIASGRTGAILNEAVVGSDWLDDQDTDDVSTGATVHADLGLAKTHPDPTVSAGTGTTFTLTVTNHGPSDAPGPIVVTDDVPAGLPLDGAPTPDGGTCTVGTTKPSGAQPVTCTLTGGLAKNGTWEIEIPVLVPATAAAATITNTATVAGPPTLDEGADTHSNTASDDVVIVREADLSITKTASAATVVAGDATGVTYTLVVENAGPSVAAATTVVDTLPAGLAPVSGSWADGTCTITGQEVRCVLGDLLESDGPVTISVVARVRSGVADGVTITNTATASSTTPDVDGSGPTTDSDDATITVDTEATLSIVKTAEAATVRAGETAAFGLVVTNDGPSDVLGPVTVTDTLPAGLTFDSSSTTGSPAWVCDDDDQEVTCTLGDGTVGLAAHADAPTLRIVAVVSAAADPGTVTNSAIASSPLSGDSDPDTADVEITTSADLGLTKTHTGTAVAGEPFAWTLTVTNGGPSDSRATAADPIVVRDTLPVGVVLDDSDPITGGGFTCVAGTPVAVGTATHEVVECTRPTTLAALATASVTVPVLLDADLDGTVTNRAVVTPGLTGQPADATLDDVATDDVTVTGVADLGLVKELVTDPADVVAGQTITWRVAVTNHGPSTSRADATAPIVVVDELPADVRDATASGPGWACTTDDGTVTCERDSDLPVGPAPDLTVTATVRSSATGDLVNVATVQPGRTPQAAPGGGGGGAGGTGSEPDTDDATVTPGASADLALVKSVVTAPVAGATGVYRLQVTNLGPSDARDVVVTDTLPTGLTFGRLLDSSSGAWQCSGTTLVECELDGPLPSGALVHLDLEVVADASLTGDVVNTATVTSSTPDPSPADNTDSVSAELGTHADLSVVKTHSGEGRVGGTLTYHLAVSNAGPSAAADVTVLDQVPASLRVTGVRADDSVWRCVVGDLAADGTPVLCTTDSLAPGVTAPTIDIDVLVGAAAFPGVVNVVEVHSSTPGADGISLATDDDALELAALVDLRLTKTFDGDVLQVGSSGTYVLTVTNAGPTPDPGPVTVTDVLPAGLTFDTARGAACAADGQKVTCTLDGLDVGESLDIRLSVLVSSAAVGTVTNTASVTSAADDSDPENNTGSVTVPVHAKPLAVTGTEAGLLALLAVLLLLGGGAAVVLARRR
ncbi:DUF7933 domain-containing protein [Cellulomonas gelida]|uniref:Gram-positive cocci surface proteins LPxTG domain-containing protein n=1 Tax=Cellulomonas gelida TaxID=1712 RepID=A0A4Y3KMM0_9CELL|nr:DUF11 domain-containing protein [Cellulomonas gelida]GEA84634.1 hypothetical protein CGE01nite_18850 [Cellulomonas gelida]GGL38917.1 hypothetical protein GCM10009774_31950 [Cellulomonas gelida]